jgi:hypothetical protein
VRKFIKRSIIAAAILLVVIQFIRPARTNPPIDQTRTIGARTQMPEEVGALLDMSCSDCHSYETKWPWYSQVAPVSWLLWSDVQEGRAALNLSDWAQYDSRRANEKLANIEKLVSRGVMPLWQYRLLHKAARLSASDVRTLVEWTRAERQRRGGKP